MSDDDAEALALGLDTRVCRTVLSGLRRDPPPRSAEAEARVAEALSRWEAPVPSSSRQRGGGGNGSSGAGAGAGGVRSRSASRTRLPGALAQPPASAPAQAAYTPSGPSGGAAPPLPRRGGAAPRGGDDSSLLGSMAARLAQVEQLNKQLSAQLAKQSQEVDAMRAELEATRQASSDGAVPGGACGECARLRSQVQQLSQVLSDYGFNWIAGAEVPETPEAAVPAEGPGPARGASRPAEPEGLVVNIQVLQSRVEGLNASLQEQGPRVVSSARGGDARARLAVDSSMPTPVTFFADGIKLGGQAFAAYETVSAQVILKDLLDGYYPKALKDEDQVFLRVVDRVGHAFRSWLRNSAHCDADLLDLGDRLRPAGGCIMRALRFEQTPGEHFLAKLPDRVLRNGRLCDIRGPIAEKLGLDAKAGGASSSRARGASVPVAAAAQNEINLLESGRDGAAPSARLQVKLESGHRVTLLMEPRAAVGAIWDALEAWRSRSGVPGLPASGKRVTLRSAFPPRSYHDRAETLQDAGLVPSATLFVSAEAQEQ